MAFPIVHVEFQVQDADKARVWYERIFGWATEKDEKLNYVTFSSGEGQMAGGFSASGLPAGAVPYVAADDIPALLNKVEAAGGKVLQPEMEIPGMGTLALFADPDGNTIGVINFPQM
jgi:predicted enzyme related to lactoylglutathione lyase